MGIAILLAAYYLALTVSFVAWSYGLLPAEPLAVLMAGILIAVMVGGVGMTATLVAWFTRQGNRRLLAISFLIHAPPVLFLLYAGMRHFLAPVSSS